MLAGSVASVLADELKITFPLLAHHRKSQTSYSTWPMSFGPISLERQARIFA